MARDGERPRRVGERDDESAASRWPSKVRIHVHKRLIVRILQAIAQKLIDASNLSQRRRREIERLALDNVDRH